MAVDMRSQLPYTYPDNLYTDMAVLSASIYATLDSCVAVKEVRLGLECRAVTLYGMPS